ncbi:protein kinase domain-containing protein [Gemmiger sp.]|jgi:serine/threonine protein kinase|uniref:protein kinase domain-containing protein n=1 Tax=Gemmiger sp. TaxID=2049027 RepID=UPI0025C582BA|nr:protein kinase [Gemmiger sp.]
MDFMLGSDYENIRPLDAKGGMGDLFRAHKKGLDVEVVIKRIKRKYIGRLDQQNEANILKGLKHQYLPRIYDVIPGEDGCLYTIMDYIPGVDLQQYVKQNGRVPQPLAHRWACQLCEVVAYLHAQTPPILHCDIKPHNIMITGQGDICLIDFNTSLVFQGDDTVVGVTKGYAAPEQYLAAPTGAVGQPAAPTVSPTAATVMAAPTEYAAPAPLSSAPSAAPSNPLVRRSSQPSFSAAVTASAGAYGPLSVRTDVYAIGATMYYMVTAATPERSLDPVTDVTAHRPAISRTMVSIIRRAMSKQQKNRFASADEMLRALQDVDKLDRRYRHFVAARRATVGVLCAAWLASAGLTLYGANLLRGERINNYLEQVAEGRAQDEDGQYAAADATLRAAVDTMPRRVEGYTALATVFYHRGDYQSAVDLAEGALTSEMLDPAKDTAADGEFYYILANCYYELSQYAESVTAYQKAIRRDDTNARYYRGLAMAQAKTGDESAAIATLNTAQALTLGDADRDGVLAELYALQGDTAQAWTMYRQVLDTETDNNALSRAYLAAAQLYTSGGVVQTDHLAEVIPLLEEAAQRLPTGYTLAHRQLLATAYGEAAAAWPDTAADSLQKGIAVLQQIEADGQGGLTTGLSLYAMQHKAGDDTAAEATLLNLQQAYPSDYRPDMELAFLYADMQSKKDAAARDYTAVAACYETAKQKYQQAAANGANDMSMTELENLMAQLRTAGWLN